MRIIAGQFRSRRLVAPAGDVARPTTDRVKESLFQHLVSAHVGGGFDGLRVLDLFAGSGALALECLSRGAAHAVMFDADRRSIRAIRTNVEALQVSAETTVIEGRVPGALKRLQDTSPFDVIFADPPYSMTELAPTVAALDAGGITAEGTLLVYEHARAREAVSFPGWLHRASRTHGETAISIFARAKSAEP